MSAVVWLVIGVVCLIAEVLTMSFVIAYFGVGALAAAAAAALGAPLWGQAAVFGVVSVALLASTRRVIVDLLQSGTPQLTNVNALIGKGAVVTIPISNYESTGQIRIGTEFWTARSIDDVTAIPAGARVEVVEIAGVTARVRPA
jgi:membrane protein implicated in regulation of membrane protease activity